MADKKILTGELGLSVSEFYRQAGLLIDQDKARGKAKEYAGVDVLPGDFPSSYQRLMMKAKRYAGEGYESIIAPEFGNKLAARLGKVAAPAATTAVKVLHNRGAMAPVAMNTEVAMAPKSEDIYTESDPKSENKGGAFDLKLYDMQMAVIRACFELPQNLDAAQVAKMANVVFEKNGWKTVSVETCRKIKAENEAYLTAASRGKSAHTNKVAKQVKRVVTELPMVYWTLDGWTVELMYQERGPKGIDYKRLVMVVVLDVWTKYPIGYAIGDRETPELIKQANRNALLHVKELFGDVYRPVQVQSDRYQLKNLTPFYQAMTHLHTPAAVGNAKAKVIEPYFKYLNKTYCQLLPNWTGFNVTASRNNQPNIEFMDKIKGTFPGKDGVVQQITMFMERERANKQEQYVSTWPQLPEERKQTMGVQEWLEVFGQPIGGTNRLTGEGLVKQLGGVKYVYDSFDPEFRRMMHLDWQVYADTTDMSRVLVKSTDGQKRFVLNTVREVPMDIMTMTDEDRAYLASVREFNNERKEEIAELYGYDADMTRAIVADSPLNLNNDEELAVKTMLTVNGQQKERLQDAKGLTSPQPSPREREVVRTNDREWKDDMKRWEELQEQRMNSNIDFSTFIN